MREVYDRINNKYYFFEVINGVEFTDPFITDFTAFLLRNRTMSSAAKYIEAIHKFWLYNLYIKPYVKENETLSQYLYDYKDIIRNRGFKIRQEIEYGNFKTIATIAEYQTTKSSTDFIALKEYFKFICNETINPNYHLIKESILDFEIYTNDKDFKKLETKAKYGLGSGYGLKPRGLSKYLLAPAITIFDELIKNKANKNDAETSYSRDQAMPIEMFNALLELTDNPKRKLYYLLCGGTSARLSQALHLTKYDIKLFENKTGIINLIDARSNGVPKDDKGRPFREMLGRKEFLLKEFNLDFQSKYPNTGFKYPIPEVHQKDRTLMFLPIFNYEKQFFELYSQIVTELSPSSPFIFQTFNCNIWQPSNVSDFFKKDLEKIKQVYPEFSDINIKGLHSLRHMYGQTMADLAYHYQSLVNSEYKNSDKIPDMADLIKTLTQHKMGHSSPDSTAIYFKKSNQKMSYIKMVLKKIGNSAYEYQRFLDMKNLAISIA